MPRTASQNEWRRKHRKIEARVELTESTKADWMAYAESQNLPLGTMIRQCIARCMEQDGWIKTKPEENEE